MQQQDFTVYSLRIPAFLYALQQKGEEGGVGTGWDWKGGEEGLVSEDSMEKCCAWDKARQQVEHRFLSACTLLFHGNSPSSCPTQLLQVPHITWQWRTDWTAPRTNKGTEITDLSHMELSPLEPVLQCAWQRCQALNGQCSFIKSPTQLQWNWEDTSHSASSAGGEVGWGGVRGGAPAHSLHSACALWQMLCLRTITNVPQRQSSPGAARWRAQAGCWNQQS